MVGAEVEVEVHFHEHVVEEQEEPLELQAFDSC